MSTKKFIPETSLKVKCSTSTNITDGFFFSDEQNNYLIRIFPLQFAVVALVQSILETVLKPFGETPVVARILGGIIAGPSVLGQIPQYNLTVFPMIGGSYLVDTLGTFGCMLYLFLVGLKMDLSTMKATSKKEWIIGILTFSIPSVFTWCLKHSFEKIYPSDAEDFPSTLMAVMSSATSFHAITCFLSDLNILNTELGRLAASSSTISGMSSWITILIAFAYKQNKDSNGWIGFTFSALGQVIFIIVVLRQVVIWMIKQTPRGEAVKQIYLFAIYIMIIGTGFLGEILGQHCLFGPMILGLIIPDGPPIASTLEHKLDVLVSGLLLPLYFFSIGYSINPNLISKTHTKMIICYFLLGLLGKLIGVIIPCVIYKLPLRDTLLLGLILSTLGIYDIQTYTTARSNKYIRSDVYIILVLSALTISGVISPLVHFLYNPSRKYIVYKKRTIQNVKPNAELRVLVCVYGEENVPPMISILEASNPTTENRLAVYLLHIIELTGRATPLLLTHKHHEIHFKGSTPSNPIINGFRIFENQNQGVVTVQPFTSITQFVSAHDDICTIAIERRTSIIITPFHKQWNIDGTTKACKWGNTNKKILKYAPCSVGILIDHRGYSSTKSVLPSSSSNTCNIGVLFLGDADDREAICYGMRMAGKSNVCLTVHRLVVVETKMYNLNEKTLDRNVINYYRRHYVGKQRGTYEEEVVKDSVEIINVIRALENTYDLILVGRSHDSYSTLLSGLADYSENEELGFFGDLFATSDFRDKTSVLVIQQHSCIWEDPIPADFDQP